MIRHNIGKETFQRPVSKNVMEILWLNEKEGLQLDYFCFSKDILIN
jgi:hypothetical protein